MIICYTPNNARFDTKASQPYLSNELKMPSLTCFNIRFTPSWFMIVLAAVFILLFTRLGFWQIERSEEKRVMLQAEAALAKQEPLLWDVTQHVPLQYQRIKAHGHYLPDIFFLDNQHQQHQFGYDVLSPLVLQDGSVVLIDRGWVPGDSTRRTLPQIDTPKDTIQILGHVYFPSQNQWILGPAIEQKEQKIAVLELLDTKIVTQVLQKKVYPFIIRLGKDENYGFVRQWAIVSMPPERHLAYALQWFAMALAILIIFLVLNLKKNK